MLTAVVFGSAAVLGASLLLVERRSRVPILPVATIGRIGVLVPLAVTALFGAAATTGLLVALSIYLQDGEGLSSGAAGASLLPMPAIAAVVALVVGRLAGRYSAKAVCVGGNTLIVMGLAYLAWFSDGRNYNTGLLPALLMLGAGFPGVLLYPFEAASQAVSPRERGLMAGLLNSAAQIFGALGVVLYLGLADASSNNAANAFRGSYLVAAALTLLAILLVLFVKQVPRPGATAPRDEVGS